MKPTPHGTPGGYTNYHCRCTDCTDAWRVYCGERRRARERRDRQHNFYWTPAMIRRGDPDDDYDTQ